MDRANNSLTLEELDQVFSVPTKVHAKYQVYNLGYTLRKYLLRSKAPHRKLYHFDDDSSEDVEKPKHRFDEKNVQTETVEV